MVFHCREKPFRTQEWHKCRRPLVFTEESVQVGHDHMFGFEDTEERLRILTGPLPLRHAEDRQIDRTGHLRHAVRGGVVVVDAVGTLPTQQLDLERQGLATSELPEAVIGPLAAPWRLDGSAGVDAWPAAPDATDLRSVAAEDRAHADPLSHCACRSG